MAAKSKTGRPRVSAVPSSVPAKSHPPKTGSPPEAPGREIIDMNEAIALLATTQPTFYRWLRTGKIKGMKVGRQWRFYRDDIERFLTGEAPPLVLPAAIAPFIESLSERLKAVHAAIPPKEDANEIRHANLLMIALGATTDASDIHITSHMTADSAQPVTVVRYRVDFHLHEVARLDTRLLPLVVEDWKRMAGCDVRETQAPQVGRIIMDWVKLSGAKKTGNVDLLASFVPTALGESLTVRILVSASRAFSLDRIGYSAGVRDRISRALKMPFGVILCTGPTGCGKTTALYSCISELAQPDTKIMTVEDPVEYFLPWATQIAIKEAAGVTFQRAFRAIMRSDPDVIMVGEIRTAEILTMCQMAATTGHLVLSALHMSEAVGALRRMLDMCADAFLVADSTRLILAQRLVRKLCTSCSVASPPDGDALDRAARLALKGGLNWHSTTPTWKKAVGCDKCSLTGYKGLMVCAEALEVTPEIKSALRNGATDDELLAIAVGQGMATMAADGIHRAAAGETTLDEVLRVLG